MQPSARKGILRRDVARNRAVHPNTASVPILLPIGTRYVIEGMIEYLKHPDIIVIMMSVSEHELGIIWMTEEDSE
jgi:hypothetical protein